METASGGASEIELKIEKLNALKIGQASKN
jgi:hypothetical protein